MSCFLVTERLWAILTSVGVPSNYPSQSFHVSAATIAAKPCLPDHLIQILGKQYNNNIFKHLQGFLQSL